MKIGILTQPLHNNYGGLLQAYALQTTLKKLGHEAWIINRNFKKTSFIRGCASFAKWFICNYFLNRKYSRFRPSEKEKAIIAIHTSYFVKKYISPITKEINTTSELKKLQNERFEAFVVGSDQVWRPQYSPCITNYFLDFAKKWNNIKRVAYAASFGVDIWEFTPKQTTKCARLAKMFDAISVREDSGVELCKKHFGTDTIHVLDPTMLLDAGDYKKIVEDENEPQSPGNLMVYILDYTNEKNKIIQSIAARLNLIPFSVMPELKFSKTNRKLIDKCIFPPVTRWLKGFMDAEFVITDSFHGTVFSIVFNKPFIAIGNVERGVARFKTLLNRFDLNDRLVFNESDISLDLLGSNIDFKRVNTQKEREIYDSLDYFKKSLE